MEQAAQTAYLETQVRTATPQRLRLMLLDGALRFANQTLDHWDQQQNEEAFEALIRCREIVVELLTSIQVETSELTGQVAEIYAILLRSLTEAQRTRDRERMEKIVKTLEVERETWRQVCEQMPDAPTPQQRQQYAQKEITTSEVVSPASDTPGSFSLDA